MGARHKLNKVAIQGALIVAAVAGLATESTLVTLVTSAVLLILCLAGGDIRLDRTERRPPRNRRR